MLKNSLSFGIYSTHQLRRCNLYNSGSSNNKRREILASFKLLSCNCHQSSHDMPNFLLCSIILKRKKQSLKSGGGVSKYQVDCVAKSCGTSSVNIARVVKYC